MGPKPRLMQETLHRAGDPGRGGRRAQADSGPGVDEPGCVIVLVPAHGKAEEREPEGQGAHDGSVPGVGDDRCGLGEDLGVRGGGDGPDVSRRTTPGTGGRLPPPSRVTKRYERFRCTCASEPGGGERAGQERAHDALHGLGGTAQIPPEEFPQVDIGGGDRGVDQALPRRVLGGG